MNKNYWDRVLQTRISRRRALTSLGATAAGAAFLAACGGDDDDGDGGGETAAQAPAEIKIGAVVPLTGRYASGGAQIKNGYEIAVDDINLTGGI